MKRLFGIGFLAATLTMGLAFMVGTEYAMADDGTIMVAEEASAEPGPAAVTDIYLTDFSWNSLSKIPKGQGFMIWVRWDPPMDEPKVIYRFNWKQGQLTYKHKIVKTHKGFTGIYGSACSTSLNPWADSGQDVTIKVKVRDVGRRVETFTVE